VEGKNLEFGKLSVEENEKEETLLPKWGQREEGERRKRS
jgi:hypothetical protein